MRSKFNRLALMLTLLLLPMLAHAVSGDYNDKGGGTYWCNVYVSSVSDGKSSLFTSLINNYPHNSINSPSTHSS